VPLQHERIVAEAERMLAQVGPVPLPFDARAPYGDGTSAIHIAAEIARHLAVSALPLAAATG